MEVSNSDAGSTFGLSIYRHENVAIKIFTVQPSAENNFAVAGPDVATMALPGKSPLKVTNDANASVVYLELKWSTKTGHGFRVFPVSIFRFIWW